MRLFVTRHGETDYNKENRILGRTEVSLNAAGNDQAAALAGRLKKLGKVDVIYCSPMTRARQTAQASNSLTLAPVKYDYRLKEWNYGQYEGQYHNASFAESKREFAVRMGTDGESLLQLAHRVYAVLDDIISRYRGTDKNVLIVTHGGVCRVIETYFNDMTVEQYSNWFMGNCEIREYEIK